MSSVRQKEHRALWVSSSLSTHGGIATFVKNMRQMDVWQEWHIHHVATHCDGSKLKRLGIFILGTAHFLLELVFRRPNVVHLHAAERGSFVRKGLLTWVSALFRVPVVIHMHGGEFDDFFASVAQPLQTLIRITLERADVVIALGSAWAQRLHEMAPDARVEVIPNGIRLKALVEQSSADEVHVVFLGELCDRKGTTVLLDAWAESRRTDTTTPAKLTIAGWGEIDRARRQIEALGIEDSVRLAGWLTATEVAQLLATSHVLVLPSINEGQPMAILEAMARGMCVVSTKVGGIPEMVDASEGVLVEAGDVAALGRALTDVINDPEARSQYGRHARQRIERDFDVEAISRRFDGLYRALLDERAK